MTPTEVTALLAVCASADNRKPNGEMVQFWISAIGDLDFAAARDAVIAHYRESTDWIMPAHIRGRVRHERVSRIEDDVIPMPPGLDPDDTAAYIRVLQAGRRALAEGQVLSEPEGLTRRNLRELGPAPLRTVAETDADERAAYMAELRKARRDAASLLKAAPAPAPAPTFACEAAITPDDGQGVVICEAPATGRAFTSEGRAYPACGEHRQALGDSKAENVPAPEVAAPTPNPAAQRVRAAMSAQEATA